ncbi:hypothetical protein [Actinophytocola sp. NPDC049390]|uniref:hypothetical protein n=1 Tax=Actinophytocola sp. NPDC049390 TaxID=3363894 RepID=UPI0037941752
MKRGGWANDPNVLLAASRDGTIKVTTLTNLGVPSRTAYRRCMPGGPWQRLLPGVVLLGNLPPTRRQLVAAALLYAGPGSVITGLEACRRHGLRNMPDDQRVHLLVPHERRAICSDYVIVERTRRMPRPVIRDGVPLAPLTRSVLDACRRFTSYDPTRALITEAVQRCRLSPRWLRHELEAGSQRGTAVPRAVLKDVAIGARSVAEIDAMRVWKRTDLPRPRWNVALRDSHGEYVAVPDAWFEVGLAWEIDSYEFHFQREDYAKTINRNARYAAVGVTVLQTLPNRLRSAPDSVAAELTAAYRAAAARSRPDVRAVS